MKKYPGAKGLGLSEATIERLETAAAKEGEEPSVAYTITVSSEFEMMRSDWGEAWREILDHGKDSIDLAWFATGQAPFLLDHDKTKQIGALSNPRIEDRKLKVDVRFASTPLAAEIRSMVDEGIRTSVSAGWLPMKSKMVEANKEKGDLWRVLRWRPMEASSVSIPANPTVGFGRADVGEPGFSVEVVEDEPPPAKKGAGSMKKVRNEVGAIVEVPDDDPREALSEAQLVQHSHAEIVRLCEAHGVSGLTADFIGRGLSPEAVALEILNRRRSSAGPALRTAGSGPDPLAALGGKERRRYSYARALSMAIARASHGAEFDGLEGEVHEELARAQAGLAKHQKFERPGPGILLPMDLRSDEQRLADFEIEARNRATLSGIAATKGTELIFERPGELIELLRNQSAAVLLGAQTLTGLSGPIAFPKQTGAMTMFWVGELPAANVTASDVALGLVTLTPRTLQGTTAYSRQLLMQASIDVEAMVRRELATTHALAIDRAVIHGLGANGQPLGIYNAPDVTSVAMGGAVDFTELTQMIGKVADANAAAGNLGWVTTPLMAAKWLATLDFSAAAAGQAIWQGTIETGGTGRVAGYRAFSTNQVSKTMSGSADTGGSEHGILFGNWSDIIIGFFGALEVIVDPYALKKQGIVEVTSYQMNDTIVRHGQSFCKATGATTA